MAHPLRLARRRCVPEQENEIDGLELSELRLKPMQAICRLLPSTSPHIGGRFDAETAAAVLIQERDAHLRGGGACF